MSKSTRKLIQTCKLICTILLVVIVGLQFIPYWYGVYTKNSSELLTEEEYFTRLAEQNAAATEPEATDPEETEPEATEPEATDPVEPTEPVKPVEPVVPTLPAIDTTEPQGFGNCNDNVATIQEKLVALGYSVGAPGIDSIFGAHTRRAVIRFQTDNGLIADGVVGPETAAAIDAAYAKLNISSDPNPNPNPNPNPDPDPNPGPSTDPDPTEPTEDETTAPSLDLGIDFYNPETAPVDVPVLTKYSIATYIWMFKENLKNDVIYMPVLMLLFAVASVVTYVKNTYSTMCSIFAVVAPAVGLMGFLTVPLYATGFQWVYILHIIANAITLIVTLGTLILRLVVFIKQVRKDRAERIAKSSFAKK